MLRWFPEPFRQDDPKVSSETRLWIPDEITGYVIGKSGRTIKRLEGETKTKIAVQNKYHVLCDTKSLGFNGCLLKIKGSSVLHRYQAKLKIKTIVRNGILKYQEFTVTRFSLINSKERALILAPIRDISYKQFFKLVSARLIYQGEKEFEADVCYRGFSGEVVQVLHKIKEEELGCKIRCKFGKIYITQNEVRQEAASFMSADDQRLRHWKTNYIGVNEEEFLSKINEWESMVTEEDSPVIYHEFTFLTPSFIEIRVKVFMREERETTGETIYHNIQLEMPENTLKHSECAPFFYVCDSTIMRACANVFQPCGLDFQFIIETNAVPLCVDENEYKEIEVQHLYNIVKENLSIGKDGSVELQKQSSDDYDLVFYSKTELRAFKMKTSDDEQFTAEFCRERICDLKKDEFGVMENRFSICLCSINKWDDILKNANTADLQKIVDQIPRFMKCVETLSRDELTQRSAPKPIEGARWKPVYLSAPPPDYGPDVVHYEAQSEEIEQVKEETGQIKKGTESLTLNVTGGHHTFPKLGVRLEIPSNVFSRPTNITCEKLCEKFRPAPTEDNETLVSYIIQLSPTSLELQEPIIVALMHSGPSKNEGYETRIKGFDTKRHVWEQIKEFEDLSLDQELKYKHNYIQVKIKKLTALGVVSRLLADQFQVTYEGCVARSSICDVKVEFQKGAVYKKVSGTMKLLMMPDHIGILDGIPAYPCPLLLINGFKGISFGIPVKIRLPHPYPAGYPSGNVRLLTMYTPHKWEDITDEVHCVENELFIELEVKHFSWLWVWIYEVPLTVASLLSRYLFTVPQDVCFAVFKENELCSDTSLTMTLGCVPNHLQFEKTAEMQKQGYTQLASSTGNKKMRPDDKAYTKVEGCYKKKLKGDVLLKFIKDDICRKELPLLKKSDKKGKRAVNSRRELVISLLEKKDGDVKDSLCTFCIDETKIVPKRLEKERSPGVRKVETVGLESIPPGPSGLCSSESVNRLSNRPLYSAASEAASCKDLEVCFGDKSIAAIDTNEAASKVADLLKLDKLSLDDPPQDIVVKCRGLCSYLKSNRRGDIVERIRDLLPSGMTGPLGDGNVLVKDMDYRTKEQISWALMAAGDQWKVFAENVRVSKDKTRFYDKRVENPVLCILNDHCENMTVEELYVHIVESDANAIADNHL